MTVYVTGDIHSGLDMQKLRDWELGDSLTSDDYLIVAGDFGFPWDFSAEECADIAWLESRPYTVLGRLAVSFLAISFQPCIKSSNQYRHLRC